MIEERNTISRLDQKKYPFQHNRFYHENTPLHYVDEGEGQTVLMLHGNPTWSFLYRNVIKALKGSFRCVAPDYPGFGLSGHPPGYGYTPPEHAEKIRTLVDRLELDDFILIVHDWGGPIGFSYATDHPGRVAGIVICNTWCWPPFANAWLFSLFMGGPIGKYLILQHNFFAKVMVPYGIFHSGKKTPSILEAYTSRFPTPESRLGTYIFPRQIRKASPWLKSIQDKLGVLREKPVRLVWAMKDPAFGKEKYIKKWKSYFPGAFTDRVEHASHYLPEDCPERIVVAVEELHQLT